jgi:hypothetical protein
MARGGCGWLSDGGEGNDAIMDGLMRCGLLDGTELLVCVIQYPSRIR